ncbi:DegT/DnrJ/EryC1/StrS family aminotransferase [Actinospica robiniae]|uniref:DegT/DnrJ/EryC1/StrS family aminotransferase n=1 Tax=Actinospica robiniae TaxID=304901 RepID=UPI0003FF3F15|nr:DegT/DnrJ/EryC1/StrS family aminotransferase [Actinospica robiniae]
MRGIPLVDLKAAHEEVEEEVREGFARVLATTGFVGGPEVAAFEQEFAAFSGVSRCVGVSNGTDALELVLRALGLGAGDEVVLPVNTFAATAEAVSLAGATPVFVDCDPDTQLIDVEAAAAAIGPRTKVLIPVHLYGQLAPVERLREALAGAPVRIVEDAAQCQGATRFGRQAGVGGVAATSFYPGKNLGAYGDAGAVVTDDAELADAVRIRANHGGRSKYEHVVVGRNSRLDALQAVVLRAKLKRLAGWNEARRAAAARYHALLAGQDGIQLPAVLEGNEHVWHLYVVKVGEPGEGAERRDAVVEKLNADGIGAGVHYPYPLHLTPAFADLDHFRGAFPHAEDAADRILSLPLHPHLTAEEQERVVERLLAAVG